MTEPSAPPQHLPPRPRATAHLAARIDALLPQTQCTRCGYEDCQAYAVAIAEGEAPINRCPPGGSEGIARLATLTGQRPEPLDPDCGSEGERNVVWIDEAWCIGCTLCIQACPVDCIIGAHKRMHSVIESACTGCELCLPACPVDCIEVASVTPGRSGWQAWSPAEADAARQRYAERRVRQQRLTGDHAARLEAKAEHKLAHLDELTKANTPAELARKRAVIEAALARARARRSPD
ncbi:MAG TPA: electron transport complex subunit RsxB [Burkholderiaceae bacterium]|nr:electron transport complex subunit RsxB [Burkholderiaceae bacterium]HMZ01144.1 electron transport complex subunit RsxB [Burkholderiaceae bacterium]HNB46252.1 electron transport complex subunit RsxB [Burkholderiaceae bacterium]